VFLITAKSRQTLIQKSAGISGHLAVTPHLRRYVSVTPGIVSISPELSVARINGDYRRSLRVRQNSAGDQT
jgi:hypothetical protein